jgi:hypothetical protein
MDKLATTINTELILVYKNVHTWFGFLNDWGKKRLQTFKRI